MGIEESETLRVSAVTGRPGSRRQKLFAVVPTLLTLGNLACGFGAITFAAKVGPTSVYGNELIIAATLIYVAMIFDVFDGGAARLTNQTSEFGAQLDSLCDAVSFGVAPAFLMLQFMVSKSRTQLDLAELGLKIEPPFAYSPRFLWVIGALFVVCVVLRLARFNVETEDDDAHDHFSGLPSPAGAGVLASIPIAMSGVRDMAADRVLFGRVLAEWLFPAAKIALPIITLVVACLMVSRLHYPHFVNQFFKGRKSRNRLLQLLVALVVIALIPEAALFLIFAYFAFAAPLIAGFRRMSGKEIPATPAGVEDDGDAD